MEHESVSMQPELLLLIGICTWAFAHAKSHAFNSLDATFHFRIILLFASPDDAGVPRASSA